MKEFRISSESYYAKPNLEIRKEYDRTFVDDIFFGEYPEDGRCGWEMQFSEHNLGGRSAIKLSIYDDTFSHLPEIQPILDKLAEESYNTIGKIAWLLVNCGYINKTEERIYKNRQTN